MTSLDLSLYLVTDSTSDLDHEHLVDTVEKAIRGGVTCVQYRDKTCDNHGMITVGRKLHDVTKRYRVPLLINDRVDVALAVGCEGVHIGQDDMALAEARRLLGPNAMIGVSVSTEEEAVAACKGGAVYLGIGAVYETTTKKDTKRIMGPEGVRAILERMHQEGFAHVQTVCIGGVNMSNVGEVWSEKGSAFGKHPVDGIAVVSAIMSAEDPLRAARELSTMLRMHMHSLFEKNWDAAEARQLVNTAATYVRAIHDNTPLSHAMTNLVVQNFSANVALAIGASPIMANYGPEAKDLSKLGGSLLINMGQVTPEGLEDYKTALKWYNVAGRPVIFDPVGAGATDVRRSAVKTIMANGFFEVIKGNEGEIETVFGGADVQQKQQRGVDGSNTLNQHERARLVQQLAARERCVVIMTGAVDVLSDGDQVFSISNGHELLGVVTGTGCALGMVLSAAVAVITGTRRRDRLVACVGAMLHYEMAAELAARRSDVRGPGTFVPAFLDELHAIRMATARNDLSWLQHAKVERL